MIVNNRPADQTTTGRVVEKWRREGYKAALEDIATIVDNGDEAIDRLNQIREWIENNHAGLYFD